MKLVLSRLRLCSKLYGQLHLENTFVLLNNKNLHILDFF
jgi:hypothetical protein